jgi:VanZ family protein
LVAFTLLLFVAGLWPFNFTEKNNAVINPAGGLEIARHGTAYTASSAGKLQDLNQFAIYVDITTSSDGLSSFEKIFSYFINQEEMNFILGQWKDGLVPTFRTEKVISGIKIGVGNALKKEERTRFLISYDGKALRVYQDGRMRNHRETGPTPFSNWDRTYPLVVGSDAHGRSQWKGTLYEVAVFDRALTSNEVVRLSSLSSPSSLSGQTDKKSKSEIAAHPAGARNDTKTQDSAAERQGEKGFGKEQPQASSHKPQGKKEVTSDQWPVDSEKEGTRDKGVGTRVGQEQDKSPLIHYVFKPEYTYETEFRGKKALAVRDMGKGEAADLVIPEQFMPYQRVYLGWDPDWTTRSSEWMDVIVNIVGFMPFGILFIFAAVKMKCLSVLVPECLSEEISGKKQSSNGKIVMVVILALVAGFVVSFAIEWLQAYLPSRDSSLRDLITNVLGTFVGAVIATLTLRASDRWTD